MAKQMLRRACPSYRFRNISGANSIYPAEKCMTTIPNGIILYISGARRAPVRRHETLLVPKIRIYEHTLEQSPAGTWRKNDVVLTSMRRDDVASTLIRRHFGTKCPLGQLSKQKKSNLTICTCILNHIASYGARRDYRNKSSRHFESKFPLVQQINATLYAVALGVHAI